MGLTSSAVSAASAAGSTLGSAAASSVEAILESPASYIPPPYQSYSSNADVAIPCIRPEGDVNEDDLCCICRENLANVLLDPCGHLKFCGECVRGISECAYCRAPINKPIRAFR